MGVGRMSAQQNGREQIVEKFVEALRAGKNPPLEDFCRQHPDDAELREMLVAARLLERVKAGGSDGTASHSPRKIPDRLDCYRLVAEIGRGGMGVVYKAIDEALDRPVAVKVISSEFLEQIGNVDEQISRFEVEARIAANLQHSNIIKVYGFGQDQGIHYLAMQLVDGLPLSIVWRELSAESTGSDGEEGRGSWRETPETKTALLDLTRTFFDSSTGEQDPTEAADEPQPAPGATGANGREKAAEDKEAKSALLPTASGSRQHIRRVVEIGIQVADALHYAHEKGVFHRDIKPGNLLLDTAGAIWVADFGLAREEARETEPSQSVGGSLRYMAPECFSGHADARSDVYALGITLHELLTYRPAFAADSVESLREAIQQQALLVPVGDTRVPADLQAVIRKAIQRDPAARYETAAEFKQELERFESGDPVRARRLSPLARLFRWTRRRPWQATALGLLILFVFLAAGSAAQSNRHARQQAELREAADAARYETEVNATRSYYQRALSDLGPTLVTDYDARVIDNKEGEIVIDPRQRLPASVRGWESDWLFSFAPEPPALCGRLAECDWGVVDMEVAPNGRFAVSTDETGLVLLWDLDTGRIIRQLAEGRQGTEPQRWLHHYLERPRDTSVADWGPCYVDLEWLDDRRVVAASLDGTARVFDVDTGEGRELYSSEAPLYRLAASDRNILLGDSVGAIHLVTTEGMRLAGMSTEHGAVTAIHSLNVMPGWCVGFENGKVLQLSPDSLEVVGETQLAGPVWDIDGALINGREFVAIGGSSRWPTLVMVDQGRLQQRNLLPSSVTDIPGEAIHAVRFIADDAMLIAGNDQGGLAAWDLSSGVPTWRITVAAREDQRNRMLENRLRDDFGWELPLVFRRRFAALREWGSSGELVTAGEDLVLKLWRPARAQASEARSTPLRPRLGPRPLIEFSQHENNLLWGLGEDGVLHLIDVEANTSLASRKVHAGGTPGLAIAQSVNLVATIGGEPTIRLWESRGNRMVASRAKKIDHTAELLSVALSPDGKWVGAVDERARLAVWETSNGELVFQTYLSPVPDSESPDPEEQLHTGRLAFNRDGSLLAAFGRGQSALLFSTYRFRRLDTQPRVAGSGGEELCWNPKYTGVLIHTDDRPRYAVAVTDQRNIDLKNKPIFHFGHCTAIKAIPNGNRIVSLEEGGRLVFIEARSLNQMLVITHPRALDSDLSFDRNGKRLVLAGRDGTLEILDNGVVERDDAIERQDDAQNWETRDVIEADGKTWFFDSRAMAIDGQARLNLLAVQHREVGQSNDLGAMFFLRDQVDKISRERILVDGTPTDERMEHEAMTLRLQLNNEPIIVFRRLTADLSPYDASVHLGIRHAIQDWTYETIHRHGNSGFYPYIELDNDRVKAVRHFSFAGYHALRSSPAGADADEWTSEHLGRAGDGMRAHYIETDDGAIHSLFNWNPVNSINASRAYTRYSKDQRLREFVDPFSDVSRLQASPQGDIFVASSNSERRAILRRTDQGWVAHCELPKGSRGEFRILASGDIFMGPQWDAERREVLLWHRQDDQWKAFAIAKSQADWEPNWFHLLLGPSDEPIVVIGRHGQANGWLKTIRRKESL